MTRIYEDDYQEKVMAGNNWYSGGFNQAKELHDNADKKFEFGNNELSRFRISVGQSGDILFLDDFSWQVSLDGNSVPIIPFCRWEHKVEVNDDWKNTIYATCTKGVAPCKFCEAGFKRNYVGAMSVVDFTPFMDKKTGKSVIKPRKKLLVAAPKALTIIEGKKAKKGNLLGWRYSVARHDKMDPKVGSDFEAEAHVEDAIEYMKKQGVNEINLDPYRFTAEKAFEYYRNIFAPMTYEQQEKLFSSCVVADGSIMKQYREPGKTSVPTAATGATPATDDGDTITY